MTRGEVIALRLRLGATLKQIAETQARLEFLQPAVLLERITEAQALLQQLQTERSMIEAELRGWECAKRRQSRRRRERRKP